MAKVRYGKILDGVRRRTVGRVWRVEETGIIRLTEPYTVNTADMLASLPKRKEPHPDYPNLRVKRIMPTELEAGLSEVVVEYSGIGGGDQVDIGPEGLDLPDPVYTLRRTQSREPITTHPNWSAIRSAAGEGNVVYDDDGIFVGISKDSDDADLVGVTDYLNFGAVFAKRYVSRTRPNLSGVGLIDTPPAQAPSASGDRNWLKVDASYTEEGDVYEINEAWMLSARGGWSSEIYGS